MIRQLGFEPVVPEGVFEENGYLAGSDEHRADQLHRLFADPSIQAIICARGGYGSLRLLASLDFGLIRSNPKVFVGFSDISTLLSAITQQCGLVTFHGPMVTTLAGAGSQTRKSFVSALSADDHMIVEPDRGVTLRAGSGTGPAAGGNLTTLCHLVGTPFQPVWRGHILFIEDRGEALYRVDRMLTQLKLAGCLDGLSGLMLGSFKDCGDIDGIYRLVMDLFDAEGLPIAAGFDIGHQSPNCTLPLGVTATLDADRCVLTYHSAPTGGSP